MYHVLWRLSALNELAALWIGADSTLSEAITAATAAIDEDLRNSPDEVGESRPGNQRIAFVPPLGFTFSV
jgi:hypothetical protein